MFGEEYVILAMLLIAPSKPAYDKVDFDRGQTKRRAEDRAQILTPLSPSLSFCVCSVCAMSAALLGGKGQSSSDVIHRDE